jgi:GNAT superfamily N-acetyltransferase
MGDQAEILVSTDKAKLDIKLIHDFLTHSYWAEGRTIEEVKITVENSFCFGLFLRNEQIGFARVMTDGVVFAYLMDVFILEQYRGNGFSKIFLKEIFSHPQLVSIPKWLLGTRDAHELYRKFGFKELSTPERLMELKK